VEQETLQQQALRRETMEVLAHLLAHLAVGAVAEQVATEQTEPQKQAVMVA
jgi:hypothetical protein